MNFAVILAGVSPGLLGVLSYTTIDLISFQNLESSNISLKRLVSKYIFIYSLIVSSLIPVLIYILIRDHINILLCAFMIIFYMPVMMLVLSNEKIEAEKIINFNKLVIIFYFLLFSFGWII